MRALLDDAGLAVRDRPDARARLDYYTRTVFEFDERARWARRAALGGGGRYDGLVEQLGGPPTPGVGWAAGVERILLASDGEADGARRPTCSWRWTAATRAPRSGSSGDLRAAGLRAQMEQAGRSLKGQLKHADRIGARVGR